MIVLNKLIKEKIELLKTLPPQQCCLADYYQSLLDKLGGLKRNYADYTTTEPIDCDVELKRTETANFDLCCALLTLLLREDHFMEYDCFNNRCNNGDVQKIINRMITVLEAQEQGIKRRLQRRAAEYLMFLDD